MKINLYPFEKTIRLSRRDKNPGQVYMNVQKGHISGTVK